jgi:hypothetical protein
MAPGDDLFDAKVTVLGEYIAHHVKEEHTDMFPKIQKSQLDLEALGQEMSLRKEALLAAIANENDALSDDGETIEYGHAQAGSRHK